MSEVVFSSHMHRKLKLASSSTCLRGQEHQTNRACSTKTSPPQAHQRRYLAAQHSPYDQTLQQQVEAGEDDWNQLSALSWRPDSTAKAGAGVDDETSPQHSPNDQTLRLQAEVGEDDWNQLLALLWQPDSTRYTSASRSWRRRLNSPFPHPTWTASLA